MDAPSLAILVLIGLSPVAYALIAWRSRGKARQARLAYLAYVVCALVVAIFQLQVYSAGGIAFMLTGVFLFPLAIAATLAIGNTVGAGSATLRVLGGATVVVALFLTLTGVWGITVLLTMAVAHAYELLVLAACIYGWREWWPRLGRLFT